MDCNCEKAPEFPTKTFIPGPIEIPINFRAVTIPADQGDDVANPPQNGAYRNVVLKYAANGHTYIYSSDGIPVMLVGSITFNSLPDRPKYDGQPMTSYTDIPNVTGDIEDIEGDIEDINGDISDINDKIAALATDFSYKGSVEDYAHLPADAATGDVYTTLDTGVIYVWDGDEWVALNEYPPVFTGTDGTSAGTVGLVPAPATTDANKVLGASGNWEQNGPTIVQTTGNSQTNVISQDGVSRLLFGNYNNDYDKERVQIGSGSYSTAGNSTSIGHNASSTHGSGIAIGYEARDAQSSVGLGAFSQPSSRGEVNIGIPRATSTQLASYGHNSTPYRLLTGLANPESGHDAVTKEYTDARIVQNAGAPTTSTVGTKGQILEDTTNGKLYICTAVTGDGGTPEVFTSTWTEIAASDSIPTVTQTIGTSTADVMSQNAVSSLIYSDPASHSDVRIGNTNFNGINAVSVGPSANATGDGSVAIGAACSTAGKKNSVALGRFAVCENSGEVNIGMGTNAVGGYANSAYRLLRGLYDPQADHDAATKGYVDTVAPVITMTSTDPGEGGTLAANNFIAVYNAS